MKFIREIVEEESQVVFKPTKHTTFVCEYPGCNWTGSSRKSYGDIQEAKNHYGVCHSWRKELKYEIDGTYYNFYLLDNEEDFKEWGLRHIWRGPGWYGFCNRNRDGEGGWDEEIAVDEMEAILVEYLQTAQKSLDDWNKRNEKA